MAPSSRPRRRNWQRPPCNQDTLRTCRHLEMHRSDQSMTTAVEKSPYFRFFPVGDTINRCLRFLGLQLTRTNMKHRETREDPLESVRIGKFQLQIPRSNPLSRVFITSPLYSSELGRLVSLLSRHYPGSGMIDVGANVGD